MTPSPNIEPKRQLFWEAFLAPIKQDIVQQMQNGPMPFKVAEKKIYQTIINGLISHLDTILTPTIIAYLRAHPNDDKKQSAYDTLFSGTYRTILSKIEHFHAPTIIHILHKVRRFRNHFYETTQRIFQDWKQICTAFGIDDQDGLSEMILTSGDAHGEGAQTSIFRFSNHQKGFVYKPVSLNMEILLQHIRKIARKWQGINRDEPEIIAKSQGDSSYGYIGLYPYDGQVRSKQEADKVYYNFGKLLAWGRFFKIADGHCDNIIINVPHVHWIDLESAFMFMEDIVYPVHPLATTGLLYEAKADNIYIGIVTGIQGGTIPRLGLTSPTVYNDGRDDMFIRYFKVFYPTKISHRIYQNGDLCKSEHFTASIQKGGM